MSEAAKFTAKELKDGQKYFFRVAAINDIGEGEYLVSDVVIPKKPIGKAIQSYLRGSQANKPGKAIQCLFLCSQANRPIAKAIQSLFLGSQAKKSFKAV